jgi:hypothetical protein
MSVSSVASCVSYLYHSGTIISNHYLVQSTTTYVRLLLGIKGVDDLHKTLTKNVIPLPPVQSNWKQTAFKIISIMSSLSYIVSALTTAPLIRFWTWNISCLTSSSLTLHYAMRTCYWMNISSYLLGIPATLKYLYDFCRPKLEYYYYTYIQTSQSISLLHLPSHPSEMKSHPLSAAPLNTLSHPLSFRLVRQVFDAYIHTPRSR